MYSQASIPGEGMFPDQIDPRINGAPADFAEIIRNTLPYDPFGDLDEPTDNHDQGLAYAGDLQSPEPPHFMNAYYAGDNVEYCASDNEADVEGGVGSDPATYSPNVAPRVPVHQVGNGNITPDVHFSESSPLDPNFPAQYQGQAGHATFASPSQAVGDYASAAEGANSAPATTFDISKLLNPVAHGVDINTLFENNDQAKLSISVTPNINLEDSTIPRTDDQKKAIVRAMCIAMASVDCAVDKKSVVKPFLEQKYSARLIEIACWRLLESMITRHDCGPLLRPFGVESKRRSHIKTFAERLEAILECLVTSKSMCKHLLDPEYSHTVVDDPVFRLKQIITNMRLNEKKGKLLAEAKEAREAKAASTDSSGKDDLFVTPTKQVFVNSNSNHDLASETRQALGAMNIRGRKSSSSSDENVAGQSVFKPTQDLRVANAQVHSTSQPHSNDGHVSQLNSSVQGPMAPPLSTPSRNRQKGSGRAAKGTRGRQTPLVTPTKAQATSTSSSLKRCRSEVDGCQDGSPTKRKAR